ncbi:MAG: HU family DNA-binding protein [Muribaculaceae bacterium]|nr:HU family DNA-binding protein [Muribaculaceae bacterium]
MNNTISLSQLITRLAEVSGVDTNTARRFLRLFFETLADGVKENQSVTIKNLGTFSVTESITGERKIAFAPDATLAQELNRPFEMFEAVELADDVDFSNVTVPEPEPEEAPKAAPVEATAPEQPIVAPHVPETSQPELAVTETIVHEAVEAQPTEYTFPVEGESFFAQEEPTQAPEAIAAPAADDTPQSIPEPTIPDHVAMPQQYAPQAVHPATTPSQDTAQAPTQAPAQTPRRPRRHYHQHKLSKENSTSTKYLIWSFAGVILVAIFAYIAAVVLTPVTPPEDYDSLAALAVNTEEEIPTISVDEVNTPATNATQAAATQAPATPPAESAVAPETKPAAETKPTPSTAKEPVYDTVEKSLIQLARKHYGEHLFWVYIFEANRDVIANPNQIRPGTKVVIPDRSTIPGKDRAEAREIAKKRQSEILSKYK